ncbi:MAG: type II toxin-antitoxin system VapC family toxin [Spirochaetales bacterium]
MRLLLDTHLLLRAATDPLRLSTTARHLIDDPDNQVVFSAVSFWELAEKRGAGREDLHVNARLLRRGLLDNGYTEFALTSLHVLELESVPLPGAVTADDFDRLLVAQARSEGLVLLTSDPQMAAFGDPVRRV